MRIINNWVNPEVTNTKFACDLARCKGACCTFYGCSGAPIDQDEITELQNAYPHVKKYLPKEHIAIIERDGIVYTDGMHLSIRCFDQRACVFVMYEHEAAICSIQYVHNKGELNWTKPRSCFLFPIRVHRNGYTKLEYEKFSECFPAIQRGEVENIPLVTFLEQPLRQEFGDEWYEELQSTVKEIAPGAVHAHGD